MPQTEIDANNPESDPLAIALVESAAAFSVDRLNSAPPGRREQIGALVAAGSEPGVMVRQIDRFRVLATICLITTDGEVLEVSQHILKKSPPSH